MAAEERTSVRRLHTLTGWSRRESCRSLAVCYGVFPAEAPEYPAAFVMLQYRYDDINIPRWAQTLVLDADKPGRDEGWI